MPELAPAKEGISYREEEMTTDNHAGRNAKKLHSSRDQWKQRSAEKQQQIRHLRVKVRDLANSRDHWKQRAADLERQLQLLQTVPKTPSGAGSGLCAFLGGLMTRTGPSPTRD
jgi:predicted  nucleic acid-binding Zn-ribbon protein